MRNEDLLTHITESQLNEKQVKVCFKTYAMCPVVGTFVYAFDSIDLLKKGMFRFATSTNLENFKETQKSQFTKIFSIDNLMHISYV